jgi:hypothetical protein
MNKIYFDYIQPPITLENGFSIFHHTERINVWDDGYANYLDLIINTVYTTIKSSHSAL